MAGATAPAVHLPHTKSSQKFLAEQGKSNDKGLEGIRAVFSLYPSKSLFRKKSSQPCWNGTLQFHDSPTLTNGDKPKWCSKIVIIKDPHMGQFLNCSFEIQEYAWIPGEQLACGHIVPTSGDAHGYTLLRHLWSGDSNET